MRPLTLSIAVLFVSVFPVCARAQTAGAQISTAGARTTLAALPAQSQPTAEVLFNADNQDERDAGAERAGAPPSATRCNFRTQTST